MRIIIPFGVKEAEVDTTGVFTSLSWHYIKELLTEECKIKSGERITGFVLTENGIQIRIDN